MESYIDRDIEEGDLIGIYSRTPLSSIIFLNIKEREGEGDGEDRERERAIPSHLRHAAAGQGSAI